MLDFSQIKLPFDLKDLIDSVDSLFLFFGPFILLSITLPFVPRILQFIRIVLGHLDNRRNFNEEYANDPYTKKMTYWEALSSSYNRWKYKSPKNGFRVGWDGKIKY
ncbi:hypothetical protein HPK10_02095 [Anoxybacillus flavithermus]|uniref:hypothetical protein n=1 Tax=Anoxybacillus flavithermus TaxID=33934 RepID=UPI001866289F|nr:hypothetical protein [Anoxybacillus flavithermus]MBE2941933.1 hypothetical protein [Anoxybacillus flavithermus]MBE2950171.1 hypothetical protein [Anoxybacillus flavithermus]MBE2953032.1 hypothetical protein [Anoxybacillus flavithermus]MBE2958385.1 hypothetical protein [Anoxybacillus flavithermus]